MTSKRKNKQRFSPVSIFVSIFIAFVICSGLGLVAYCRLFLNYRDHQGQILADLLQIPTYDEVFETMNTRYPMDSSTHDSFDPLFSSLSDSVRYFCNYTWTIGSGCPKDQCTDDYRCSIGNDIVFEVSFYQNGEIRSYSTKFWDDNS
jgi:hypothetical protein